MNCSKVLNKLKIDSIIDSDLSDSNIGNDSIFNESYADSTKEDFKKNLISLEKSNKELELLHDKYIRINAEFENFKKRSQREYLNGLKYANESMLFQLLPILDHLEEAVLSVKKEKKYKGNKSIILGIEMVLKQFIDVMKKFNIESFSSKGELFNPELHEAIAQETSKDVIDGTVLREYQKGYKLYERIVRAAKVVVSKSS
jgi:molecular chaperone GrpE